MIKPDSTAFPTNGFSDGLTKREHFASLAMQGILADPNYEGTPEAVARSAVLYADSLIAALNDKRFSELAAEKKAEEHGVMTYVAAQ